MATMTIKNLPDELYRRLKQRASDNRRSINSEIIVILEQALQTRMRTPAEADKLLREARKLRELTAKYMITAAEMDRWKKEGRE